MALRIFKRNNNNGNSKNEEYTIITSASLMGGMRSTCSEVSHLYLSVKNLK